MHSIDFYQFSSGDCHTIPPSYVPKDLFSVSKVWLRVDRIRRSLEAPYSGPFTVIERNPKYFILDLPHGPKSVSIDRLTERPLVTRVTSRDSIRPVSKIQLNTRLQVFLVYFAFHRTFHSWGRCICRIFVLFLFVFCKTLS